MGSSSQDGMGATVWGFTGQPNYPSRSFDESFSSFSMHLKAFRQASRAYVWLKAFKRASQVYLMLLLHTSRELPTEGVVVKVSLSSYHVLTFNHHQYSRSHYLPVCSCTLFSSYQRQQGNRDLDPPSKWAVYAVCWQRNCIVECVWRGSEKL